MPERKGGDAKPIRTALSREDGVDLAIIELLFFAYRDFTSDPDQILAKYEFGRAHHRVLHFVNRHPGLMVAELLTILDITKQSLARVLRDLVAGGFIEQRPGAEDRRQRLLFLTEAGAALAGELLNLQKARVGRAMATVEPREQAAVERFLLALVDGEERGEIARLVHTYSGRRGPFVAVNCAALVETLLESELFGHERGAFTGAHAAKPGKFEQAAEGTLFLDEVGELPLTMQAKLLRVLQEGVFERVGGTQTLKTCARIVAATNRDLLAEAAARRFREDLLYRLAVVTLHVPPLRERREDILPLARHLLARAGRRLGHSTVMLAPDAEVRLRVRDWPGNVRELDNVLARALLHVRGPVLTADLLDGPVAVPLSGTVPANAFRDPNGRLYSLDELEAMQVANALYETNGHKGRACAILGISRPALERKLDRYGLRPRARTED